VMRWAVQWIDKERLRMLESVKLLWKKDTVGVDNGILMKNTSGKDDDDEKQERKDKLWNEINPENPEELTKWKADKIFVLLQMLTSVMVCFARGANDVSNGVGPFAAIYDLYDNPDGHINTSAPVELWALAIGGVGIGIGLLVLGRRVIKAVGDTITTLSPSRGICIEMATALTVLVCSALGLPVSSTHTLVGSVFGVAVYKEVQQYLQNQDIKSPKQPKVKNIQWKNIITMFISWILTVPAAALVSIAIFYTFKSVGGDTTV